MRGGLALTVPLAAPLSVLGGCGGPVGDSVPPPPAGAGRFSENGSWEVPHDLFASDVRRTLQGRYGNVVLTEFTLPRSYRWAEVGAYYDASLQRQGWRQTNNRGLGGGRRDRHLAIWTRATTISAPRVIAVAMLERPDPSGLGLPHSLFVGVSRD